MLKISCNCRNVFDCIFDCLLKRISQSSSSVVLALKFLWNLKFFFLVSPCDLGIVCIFMLQVCDKIIL